MGVPDWNLFLARYTNLEAKLGDSLDRRLTLMRYCREFAVSLVETYMVGLLPTVLQDSPIALESPPNRPRTDSFL